MLSHAASLQQSATLPTLGEIAAMHGVVEGDTCVARVVRIVECLLDAEVNEVFEVTPGIVVIRWAAFLLVQSIGIFLA